jgi:hypothetical protein
VFPPRDEYFGCAGALKLHDADRVVHGMAGMEKTMERWGCRTSRMALETSAATSPAGRR